MAKRQTREERQAADEQARREREAAEFRQAVGAERAKIVVEGSRGSLRRAFAADGDQKQANLLYAALYNVERFRAEVDTKLRWLRSSLDDLDRSLARGDNYSSSPVGGRGSELDAAWASYTASRDAAKWIADALNVYCPMLDTTAGQARRATMLAVTVERRLRSVSHADDTVDTGWRLMRDGVALTLGDLNPYRATTEDGAPNPAAAALPMFYSDETSAWLAFRVLVHGR